MEVRDNEKIGGKGLYSTKQISKGDVVFVLTGQILDRPTRESIHIGNNCHIYDANGIYMNHSFEPTTFIDGCNVTALTNIEVGDELTFNYNSTEIAMACPFVVDGKPVVGVGECVSSDR